MLEDKKYKSEVVMTLKRMITLLALLASFSALAIPPIPPTAISKPVKGSTKPVTDK